MATRRERVVIELEDGLTAGVLREAAAVAVLNRELDKLGRTSTSTKRDMDPLARETIPQTTRNVDSASKSIDKFSGRLSLLVDGLTAIGPAAVPIGAVAVPAVSTLASGLGFLAVGAGTTVLAFHNLGDALTKFNKAAAEPTATNIAAAQAAMDKIGPSAQEFVLELHKLGPELVRLQEAAGSGLFPGLTAGIREAQDALPAVERIFQRVGTEIGDLSAQAGKSLGGPEWAPFLKFIGDEAPHALATMGHALGSVTHGLAELWMATQPLNSGGLDWIAKAADGFDRWATGLDKTQGFQDFVAYIQQNGPEVEQLLADTANLFVDIVKAAAPLGGPTLHALDLLVKALDLIANSPLATPLLALLQLNSVLKLTSSGLGAVGINADLNLRKKIVGGAKAATDSLLTVTSAQDRARLSSEELARVESTRAASQRSTLLKGGAAVAAFGFLTSGVADKMDVTQTATLALTGAMVGGVPGAVAGGLVGAVMDYRSAASQATSTQRNLNNVFSSSTSSIDDYAAALSAAAADARSAYAEFGNDGGRPLAAFGDTLKNPFGAAVNAVQVAQGTDVAAQTAAAFNAAQMQQINAAAALAQIGSNLGDPSLQPRSRIAGIKLAAPTFLVPDSSTQQGLAKLTELASRAQPAMDALGISLHRLSTEPPAFQERDIAAITKWIAHADSAAGRTQAVGKAFAAMGDDSLTASDRIKTLTDSLDALIDPMLSLGQSHDAFRQGLNDLDQSLAKHNKSLVGNTDAAIKNRDAIRSQVSNLKGWIEAQANAGVPAKTMIDNLKAGRQAIIDQGEAAGLNRKQIQHMLDVMHLTPKFIKTTIQLAGTAQAEKNLQHLTRDRVIHITARVDHLGVQDTTATGGHVLTGHADGGTVGGAPRRPYGDKVIIAAAPGEEIITNRHGEADKFRADRASGRIPAYADGGEVRARSFQRAELPDPSLRAGWSQRAPEIDYARLTRALLAARPLYGDPQINGDPTMFRLQMEQDSRRAAMGAPR